MALHSGLLKGALSLSVADCGSFPERVVIKFLPLYFLLYFVVVVSNLKHIFCGQTWLNFCGHGISAQQYGNPLRHSLYTTYPL